MNQGTHHHAKRMAQLGAALSVSFVAVVFYLVATTAELPSATLLGASLTLAFALASTLLIEFGLWAAAGFPRRTVLAAGASRHDLFAANPEAAGSRTLLEPAKREIQAASLSGPDARRHYPPVVRTIEDQEIADQGGLEDEEGIAWN
jgi:hypothetical protein